ncbi:NADH-quinone oxidoreductase subunit NuoB [Clostridium oceanicum]|uniref:4Fe-4S ferredoxin-type domain-containing protein n=1 Tax=Clostridium oceanicum TaxID=1543 RepID=A0ABN1JFV2_9CLOT
MKFLIDRLKNGKDTVKNPLCENPFSYGKISVDKELCNMCKKCIGECLVNAISLKENKIKIDHKKCMFCKECINNCPSGALTMTNDYKMSTIEILGDKVKKKIYSKFNRSLVLRAIDTGSCNGCLMEVSNSQNNYYDLSRYGVSFAASPRHADGIVVTGPVSLNMKEALIKTYNSIPDPKIVIAVGGCAYNGGIFKDGYGVCENLNEILPVNLVIPGCPPSPQAILEGILHIMDRK